MFQFASAITHSRHAQFDAFLFLVCEKAFESKRLALLKIIIIIGPFVNMHTNNKKEVTTMSHTHYVRDLKD